MRELLDAHSLLIAILAGLLIDGCGFVIDLVVHDARRLLASDLYTFLVASILSYVLLQHQAHRRAVLRRRMEIAADVNHHIRNALTGIVFTAAVQDDPALESVLKDATARIDWVLNTVLPDGAADLQWPVQAPTWQPSSWPDPSPLRATPRPASPISVPAHLTHAAPRGGRLMPDPIDENSLGPLGPNILSIESIDDTTFSVQGHNFVAGFKLLVHDPLGQPIPEASASSLSGTAFTLSLPYATPGPCTLTVVNPDNRSSTLQFATPGTTVSNQTLRAQ